MEFRATRISASRIGPHATAQYAAVSFSVKHDLVSYTDGAGAQLEFVSVRPNQPRPGGTGMLPFLAVDVDKHVVALYRDWGPEHRHNAGASAASQIWNAIMPAANQEELRPEGVPADRGHSLASSASVHGVKLLQLDQHRMNRLMQLPIAEHVARLHYRTSEFHTVGGIAVVTLHNGDFWRPIIMVYC